MGTQTHKRDRGGRHERVAHRTDGHQTPGVKDIRYHKLQSRTLSSWKGNNASVFERVVVLQLGLLARDGRIRSADDVLALLSDVDGGVVVAMQMGPASLVVATADRSAFATP